MASPVTRSVPRERSSTHPKENANQRIKLPVQWFVLEVVKVAETNCKWVHRVAIKLSQTHYNKGNHNRDGGLEI